MSLFSSPSKNQINLGLLLLRVAVGAIFVMHGGQKLFVFGFDGVAGVFGGMGVPMPQILGPFVALVEFFGGLALVFGLLTRLAALGLVGDMLIAILMVHMKNGFFNPGGFEFPMALLASSAMLTIAGAGNWSIDSIIGRKRGSELVLVDKQAVRKAA